MCWGLIKEVKHEGDSIKNCSNCRKAIIETIAMVKFTHNEHMNKKIYISNESKVSSTLFFSRTTSKVIAFFHCILEDQIKIKNSNDHKSPSKILSCKINVKVIKKNLN